MSSFVAFSGVLPSVFINREGQLSPSPGSPVHLQAGLNVDTLQGFLRLSESNVDAPLVEWLNTSRKLGIANSLGAAPAGAVERLKPRLLGDWTLSERDETPTPWVSDAPVTETGEFGVGRFCGIRDGVFRRVPSPAAVVPTALPVTVRAIIEDYLTAYGYELGDGLFTLRDWNEALQAVAPTILCLCAQTLMNSHVRGAVMDLRRQLASPGDL